MALKVKATERLVKFSKTDEGTYRYVMLPELYTALNQEKVIKASSMLIILSRRFCLVSPLKRLYSPVVMPLQALVRTLVSMAKSFGSCTPDGGSPRQPFEKSVQGQSSGQCAYCPSRQAIALQALPSWTEWIG